MERTHLLAFLSLLIEEGALRATKLEETQSAGAFRFILEHNFELFLVAYLLYSLH
jgi:hypothetical protein